MKFGWLGLAATLLAPLPALAQAPGEESAVLARDCDRACLVGHLHEYMAALKARNPAKLPLAQDVQFTENNVVMPLGEGLWGTVSDVAEKGMEVADPDTGQAAWFGYVREHGQPSIYAMRIKVVGGRLSEIETVVHRKTGLPAPFGDVTRMEHDSAFEEVLPPEQRRSRARLIAVADSYFSTVEVNDGMVFAPFAEDCGRLENGISTTSSAGGGAALMAQGCENQFKLGMYRINKWVRERRYPIVDVERGVVVATAFFDHANEWDRYKLTDGREMKTALKWPNSISLIEAFRVRDGKIHRIEAVFTYVPYYKHNPWDTRLPVLEPPAPERDNAAAPDCDAACLTRAAESYMDALVAKDRSKVDWAKTVRFAENGVPMMVGEGPWGSVTARGKNALIVPDPASNSVAWIGTVEEHGQPGFYAMRLRVEGRRVASIESIVRRQQGRPPYGDPVTFARDPLFAAKLPKEARMPRARMEALVAGYYASLKAADGSVLTQFAPDCVRVQNGVTATTAEQGCEAQFKLSLFQATDGVRFVTPVVDEERGIVVAMGWRDQSARRQSFTATDGKGYSAETHYPFTYGFVTAFRLADGRIQRIDEVASEVSYRTSFPWE